MSASPSLILQSLGLKLLDFNVVNMELSNKALEFHLLKHTLRVDHPEYAVRHRALLVDRTFYENQIENSKVGEYACLSQKADIEHFYIISYHTGTSDFFCARVN